MTGETEAIAFALHELDMAALMGGPLFRPEVEQLTQISQELHQQSSLPSQVLPNKRRKVNHHTSDHNSNPGSHAEAHTSSPQHASNALCTDSKGPVYAQQGSLQDQSCVQVQHLLLDADAKQLLPPDSLQGHSSAVPTEDMPSLER